MIWIIYLGLVLFLPLKKRAGLIPIPKNQGDKKVKARRGGWLPPLSFFLPPSFFPSFFWFFLEKGLRLPRPAVALRRQMQIWRWKMLIVVGSLSWNYLL